MFEILLAFVIDLVFGDPVYSWHPVRILGGAISKVETWLRPRLSRDRLAGFVEAVFIPTATFGMVWFLITVVSQIYPFLGTLLSTYFIYSSIAVKDLRSEARRIYACLINRKLEAARKNLSRIVGRDTAVLEQEEIIRGTVETVAESFVDGILSPLFYAALGGAPLAMAYKAVNTLDSMVGHRTPRYREFGFASAKFDEIVNWIPARISWILIGIAAFFVNGRTYESWHVGWKDGAGTGFANSAVPEAAFAGALGVQLGGTNLYQGEKVETPKLGYPIRSLEIEDIRRANKLMIASAWVALGFVLVSQYLGTLFVNWMGHPLL